MAHRHDNKTKARDQKLKIRQATIAGKQPKKQQQDDDSLPDVLGALNRYSLPTIKSIGHQHRRVFLPMSPVKP